MKFFHVLLLISYLLLSLGAYSQEFKPLSLKEGQIKGITLITEGTEKTARPVIWVHGIQETSERWKEFMKQHPDLNHFAVNLPMHGVGENITKLKGANDYQRFYEVVLPNVIEHVYQTTGQKPVLVGFSLGAKTVHDSLAKVPGLADKVEGVVELMRPNQIGSNVPLPKSPLKLSKPILGLMDSIPTMPNYDVIKKAAAKLMPSLPDGVYTHVEGTEMKHLEQYISEGQSSQIGNELNIDMIDDINTKFSHADNGLKTWFVWADNDMICPGGEQAFNELVRLRAQNYVNTHPVYTLETVIKMVQNRNFPPGLTPIYGTSMGDVGHIGAVVPGSKSAKLLGNGIGDIVKNPEKLSVPAKVRLKVSGGNGLTGCAKDGVYSVLSGLLGR